MEDYKPDQNNILENLLSKGNITFNENYYVGGDQYINNSNSSLEHQTFLQRLVKNIGAGKKIIKPVLAITSPIWIPKISKEIKNASNRAIRGEPILRLPGAELEEKKKMLEDLRDEKTGILTLYYYQKKDLTPMLDFIKSILEDNETIENFSYIFNSNNKFVKFFLPKLQKEKTQIIYIEEVKKNNVTQTATFLLTKEKNNCLKIQTKSLSITKDADNNSENKIEEIPDTKIEVL